MCTPIGHSLVGYSVLSHESGLGIRSRWIMFLHVLALANLPDIDFLFGWARGNPNAYHHLWTHSLIFALLAGGLYGAVYTLFLRRDGIKAGGFAAGIVLSHLVLDFFSKDTREPCGMPLFWPFSNKFLLSPVTIFQDVHKASSNSTFLGSLFCWHNLWTILLEVAVLSPVIAWLILKGRKSRNPVGPPLVVEQY